MLFLYPAQIPKVQHKYLTQAVIWQLFWQKHGGYGLGDGSSSVFRPLKESSCAEKTKADEQRQKSRFDETKLVCSWYIIRKVVRS